MATVDERLLEAVKYRCIGPSRGGRVLAVSADPDQPNVFYFGACAGGIWRSDDAGQYWENISDGFLSTAAIGALAVAPSDGNVIYAGTGEATIRIDVTHGDGVYKSTDAGRSWANIGLPESRHIGRIEVDPTDPDTVFVAALGHSAKDNPDRGLYRSTDGGATWDHVLYVSDQAGAADVSIDPTNPRIVYASIWQTRRNFWSINSGGPDCGLWRSLDGGDTWENISENAGLPTGTIGKIGMSASAAQSGRVFAIIEAEFRKRGLYRSDDHGDTWTKVSSRPDLCWRPWYYMHVEAHPTEPDTVFVFNKTAWKSIDGGKNFDEFETPHGDNHGLWIDPKNPDRMIGCDDGGAWVSVNAGKSWSTIYNQLTAQFYHVAVDDQYPYLVYGTQQDNSSIAVPSQTGKGAINWGDCFPPGTAESGYIAPKPGDPDIVFVGAIGSSPGGGEALQRFDRRTGQVQLVSIWPEAYHDGATAEVRFQWTYPIVFSPQDSNTLYACGNKVFKTTDEGHSWTEISPDLTYADPDTLGVSGPLTMDTAGAEMYATIFSFVASAHRAGTLIAGSDDGRVHVTHDDGNEWVEVTPPDLPKFSQVTMLAESPHSEGTVYMTVARHKEGDYDPYVYKTTDFGGSWQRIDTGLPEGEFCRVVREDPNCQGLLYVGTELGLWASFDDGANWQSLQANLPVSPVYDLVVKDTDMIVATHGRSFWILDDLTQLHQACAKGTADQGAHLFAPRDAVRTPVDLFADFLGSKTGKNYHVTIGQNATFELDEDDTGFLSRRVLDGGTDLDRGVRISYWLGADPESPLTLAIVDGDGNEIDSFTSDRPEKEEDRDGRYATAKVGMNVFQWDMRHAPGPKVEGSEFHGRAKAPLCVPGTYSVRLDVDGDSQTVPFNLLADPRVDCRSEDFEGQRDLLLQIQGKLNQVVDCVNGIRLIESQVDAWKSRIGDDQADIVAAGDAAVEALKEIEGKLIQREFTSSGDTLNYREMLFEKLAGLEPVVASADAAPTTQSFKVYDKLAGLIDQQLADYNSVLDQDVASLNQALAGLDVGIVGA